MRYYFIILFSALFALSSCSRQPSAPVARASYQLYTEDDVRKFIAPGTPLIAIAQRFGEPCVDEKNPKFENGSTNIDEIVYFFLPAAPPGTKEDFAFCGFQVRLKGGKAVDWFSSHRTAH